METKKKILIVDDDVFLLDMYALKFSQSNFDVITALGPEVALEKVKDGLNPDVMILDIIMPVMDGFEFLEKINEEQLMKDTIKILLSNRGQQSDIARGEALGASGYIVKASNTPSEVVQKVVDIINKK
ncbi:MAG: response regulator [Candidatus Nomurabacteria bacterium]|nr:response regulator [Candidatus Nomurabacteria bacterium]